MEAFASAVARLGGSLEIATVERLTPAGTGWRAILSGGRELTADRIVVADGCDAKGLLEPLGVELPVEPESRFLFLSDPIRERLLEPLVIAGERRFAAKQLASGRVLASDLGAESNPEEGRPRWIETVNAGIRSLVPILEYVSFPVLAEGIYDVTPDHQPILDEAPVHEGLWVAAGFSGHGFMLAPAVGRLMSGAILGDRDPLLDAFSLGRFGRSEAVPETQVI